MTKFKIYKLHFTSPLHLGDERDDYSISLKTIHSDTLYAALTSALAKIGKEIPGDGDLGFTISSLFPFYQKNEKEKAVYFLPKLLKQNLVSGNHQEYAKKIKKITWLDSEYFQKQISGHNLFDNDFNVSHIKGEYLTNKEFDADFISSQIFPRVTVSRSGEEDAKPFYMDRLFFKDYSGLYFIVEGESKNLDIALDILKHEGIGTDRNVGNGYFTFSTDSIDLKLPESDFAANLSLFLPESKDQLTTMINGSSIAYDFIRRGGWITTTPHNTIRKNSVYMFTESSVFGIKETKEAFILGKTVDLKPTTEFAPINHPVWRNGKAIFIPVKI